MTRVWIALALIVAVSSPAWAQTDRVRLYVGAPVRDGFTDLDDAIGDSIRDIRTRLRLSRTPGLVVVDDPADADLTLTVLMRGVGSETYGQRLSYTRYYQTAVMSSTPVVSNAFWVATVLEAGDYRREFIGTETRSGMEMRAGAWTACARAIADDVKTWLAANRAALRERTAPAADAP